MMHAEEPKEPVSSPEDWVILYGDYLFNYSVSRVNDKDMAMDLVQETFLAALGARNTFEGRSSERTWLISILKRKVVDHYRKSYRRKEDALQDSHSSQGISGSPFHQEGKMQGHWMAGRVPHDWKITADKALENEELRIIIAKCVAALPEKWNAVFTLRVIEELASEDVCKELGITASNLWVILHRAKLQLRECIEKNWLK
jgi:RNA polymerase sigma-70 factor (ECF subfamily)